MDQVDPWNFGLNISDVRKQRARVGWLDSRAGEKRIRRRPTLPRNGSRSTIGAEELNGRVRDGNGCVLLAIATGNRFTE